jgi:hypothetical protein
LSSTDRLQTGQSLGVKVPAKNVREWIQFFYQEAEMRSHTPLLATKGKSAPSPYQKPLPFLG